MERGSSVKYGQTFEYRTELTLEQTMKAQGGRGGIEIYLYFFFNFD